MEGGGKALLLDALLTACQAKGWLKARGRQRTDSTHILAAIHVLHRVELVGQTLQYALNDLAQIAPVWLKSRLSVDWFERYGRKLDDYRLPKTEAERLPVAQQLGQDGQRLLAWIDEDTTPTEIQTCPAIAILRQVWAQQYELDGEQAVVWRPNGTLLPSAQRISSLYDPDARYSAKRGMEWVGYRVHLTECCEATFPPSHHPCRNHASSCARSQCPGRYSP